MNFLTLISRVRGWEYSVFFIHRINPTTLENRNEEGGIHPDGGSDPLQNFYVSKYYFKTLVIIPASCTIIVIYSAIIPLTHAPSNSVEIGHPLIIVIVKGNLL